MLFSDCFMRFVRIIVTRTPHNLLGSYFQDAIEGALTTATGMTRREVQALGRVLLLENAPVLLQACPAALSPLGVLCNDPKGDVAERARPICCNSLVGQTVGVAFITARQKRFGDATALVDAAFCEMEGHDKFNLFRPLGRVIVKHLAVQGVDGALASAWDRVKSNKEGPLTVNMQGADPLPPAIIVDEPAPSTLKSSRRTVVLTSPSGQEMRIAAEAVALMSEPLKVVPESLEPTKVEAPSRLALTDEELEQILRGVEEDPKRSAEALQDVDLDEPVQVSPAVNIKHTPSAAHVYAESFDDYRHVLKNEPAFVGTHMHPRHGLLFVMIAVDGVNELGQTVYRGGAIFDPAKNKMVTHKYISPIVGPFKWTDEAGAKYVVKGIPWRRGLCGKFWTNVARGTGQDDIEDMKRWFLLTTDEQKRPSLRIWSGQKGEQNFNAYLNSLRRRMSELRKAA